MAVSKKKVAADEKPPAAVKKAVAKAGKSEHIVMLGNDCQRFMTPKHELYLAGRKYGVTDRKRTELFGYCDINGIQYFYDSSVIEKQIAAAKRRGRRFTQPEEDTGEMDTGVVHLQDEEGETVGSKGDGGDGDSVSV